MNIKNTQNKKRNKYKTLRKTHICFLKTCTTATRALVWRWFCFVLILFLFSELLWTGTIIIQNLRVTHGHLSYVIYPEIAAERGSSRISIFFCSASVAFSTPNSSSLFFFAFFYIFFSLCLVFLLLFFLHFCLRSQLSSSSSSSPLLSCCQFAILPLRPGHVYSAVRLLFVSFQQRGRMVCVSLFPLDYGARNVRFCLFLLSFFTTAHRKPGKAGGFVRFIYH